MSEPLFIDDNVPIADTFEGIVNSFVRLRVYAVIIPTKLRNKWVLQGKGGVTVRGNLYGITFTDFGGGLCEARLTETVVDNYRVVHRPLT